MAWQVEQVRPIGSIAPTTSSSLSTQGVSGNGVVLISFLLASLASLEVIVGPEANGKDISVLYVLTNSDFIFSSETGGQVFVTPITGTGYKSISINNTTGSVYNVGIWIHATNAGTAIGSVPVYYACHNYNQYYVLNTESITVTKSTGTVMINQTGLSNCFKQQVQKIAATIPALCVATFYSGNTNVETGANIDVYGYSASTNVGISESTGAPTSFLTSDDNSQGNGLWKLTYSNTTNSAVTIYLYSKTSSNANRFATIYYSGEAISSGAWSAITATLNVPTSAGNYATTSISTLGAGKYLNATFTPTVTGTYQCWSQFTGDAYMFIGPTTMSVSNTNGAVTGATTSNDDGANNAFGSGNYGSNLPFCEISLTANTTYRMVIRHYSSTSSPTSSIGAGTVYIGLKIWHRALNMSSSTSLTSFTAGTPKTLVSSAGNIANGTYYIYPFTVDTTGLYYIASGAGTISGDTYGFISTTLSWIAALTGTTRTLRSGNILASDDDGNTSVASNQYKITVNLDAGTTYYLYHMGYNTSSTSSGNPITVTLVSGGSAVNKAYLASNSAYSSTWEGSSMNYPAYVIGKGTTKNTVLDPLDIKTINFVLSYTPTGTELGSWDASEDVDGSITAYALADGETLVVAKTNSSSDKIYYKNGSTCVLTEHMYNVISITGCGNIDTSGVEWFYYTLSEYSGTSIPSGMENWDVSSATHFDGFFWNCSDLTNITLYWNTASAINMSGFFYNCHSALDIWIPNINTRNCTNLGNFFDYNVSARRITVGANFTRMGNGSTNLINFPNPALFTTGYGSSIPTDSALLDKWHNVTTGAEYTYDNVPNLTLGTYILYGSDGRPTLATYAPGTGDNSSYRNLSGSYIPYWLYTGYSRASVQAATLRAITRIETRDSYSGTANYSWDASLYEDSRVHCYINGTTLIIAGNGSGYIDLALYSSYLFAWLPNLVTIDVPLLNTYNPTNTNFSPKCKTQSFSFMCAYSANIEEINISGINFYNMPNTSWKIYVYSYTSSGGTYTTVFPAKLSKLTVGNKYKTDCAGPITTPTAGNTVVPSDGSTFDGSWHDETGASYTPGSIAADGIMTYPSFPSLTAHVYTAYMPYIPTPEYHSVWKLYNGTEWVEVYPLVYNGSSWVPLKGMVYDATDNEWK